MINLNNVRLEVICSLEGNKHIDNECWIWTKSKDKGGYGTLTLREIPNGPRQIFGVHRLSAWLYKGFEISNKEIHILHKCDRPACFNPDHLFEGNNFTNQQDRVNKGRHHNQKWLECPKGHPYEGDNLYLSTDSQGYTRRHCKKCRMDLYWEKKAKKNEP